MMNEKDLKQYNLIKDIENKLKNNQISTVNAFYSLKNAGINDYVHLPLISLNNYLENNTPSYEIISLKNHDVLINPLGKSLEDQNPYLFTKHNLIEMMNRELAELKYDTIFISPVFND